MNFLPAVHITGLRGARRVGYQHGRNTACSKQRKNIERILRNRGRFAGGRWKTVATGAPSPPSARGARVIGNMLIEHRAFGRQGMQGGCIDPEVAIAAQVAEIQSCGSYDDNLHGGSRGYAMFIL